MPGVYAEEPFDYAAEWKECLDDHQVGGGVAVSRDAQDGTRCGFVPAHRKRACARYFLGLSYVDASLNLAREPPARDPEFPQLRAHSIAFTDLVPEADPANPNNSPYAESPFYGADGEPMWHAKYEWCMATVRFKSFGRTRFLKDSSPEIAGTPRKEWLRWVDITTEPSLETLSVQGTGSGLTFVEGPAGMADGDERNPKGKRWPAETWEYMPKCRFVMRWLSVPEEYLSTSAYIFYPHKILERLGRVNDSEWLDCPAGTLLLEGVRFTPCLFPVVPAAFATEDHDAEEILAGWDVEFLLNYFDPPRGNVNGTHYGHNLFPWRGTNKPGIGAGVEVGKWYYCTRTGAADGPPFIPTADFTKMFIHPTAD